MSNPQLAVPAVVLSQPVPMERGRFARSLCAAWDQTEAALADVVRSAQAGASVEPAIRSAVDAARDLAQRLLATSCGPDPAELPPPVPIHSDYFRIRHAELTPEAQAAWSVLVIFRTLADLQFARLDVNDLVSEISGFATVLELQRPEPVAEPEWAEPEWAEPEWAEPEPAAWFEPSGNMLDRWFLAHHAYFLLNMYTAAELDRAVAQLQVGATGEAERTLRRIAVLIRGFTAGMVHAAAMPAKFYGDVVRPTMAPPAVPVNLTGVQQLEHKRYRRALRRLLDQLPAPFAELADRDFELAVSRDAVLEADLVDMERHVLVAATLVGGERSLVQRVTTPVNATSALREMRHVRGASYARMMQFGDRWLTETSPAS